jgi:hypothetical protein
VLYTATTSVVGGEPISSRWVLPSEVHRPKLQVTLTCKCGVPQYPHSHHIPTRCVNSFCTVVWNPSEAEEHKYRETILALLNATELYPESLAQSLHDANTESAKVKSPFAISIRLMEV